MNTGNDQIAQLEAAIAAQEQLRATLGDAAVDATIAVLRQEAEALRRSAAAGGRRADLESRALASMRSHLPEELAAKARAAGHVEGERKQVTVLFADLSGFTAVSERADPELIRAFQTELFGELARIIYQYEGFVEKFAGDAVLAVFGAPVTHEDDPERALRVALAMRERMARLNRHWSDKLGSPVTLHVGINTGPVVAGKFGADLEGGATYAVTGDTVNTASRLQDAAQPGDILVSRTTYRLAQEAFTFQALDPINVRGRTQPVPVYRLLRARPLPGKVRGIQDLGEVFVGREDQLALLVQQTTDFANGGRIVVVTGEAGIGKSRLVAEWRKQTENRVRWLEGRCFTHTWNLSYGPFLDMLRRFAGIVDDDTERRARQRLDAAVEHLAPGDTQARIVLAHLLGMHLRREETAVLAKLSARQLRDQVFELAEKIFGKLAQEQPLVLFLEDMQWTDASTLDLVRHLLDRMISSVPLALVIAGRPEAEQDVDAKVLNNRYAERTTRITLEPLTETSSLAMLRGLLSVTDPPERLASIISDKAEGNPFFVEEMIRAHIELGALRKEGDRWVTTPLIDTIHVPETLRALIGARIDRLPDETKEVVQHAAVIGRTFLYRVLLAIAQSSPTLDADLSHLQRSELIRERTREPEVEFTFKHALTQEVAYETLLQSRQREFHRRVGEAMERIFAGRLGEFYAVLAEHFRKAAVWDKVAEYEFRAGEHASQLFATEAPAHFAQALGALERVRVSPDSRRRRVDTSIALAREVLYGTGTAHVDLRTCLEHLERVEQVAMGLVPSKKPAPREDQLRLARLYGWMMNAHSVLGDSVATAAYLDKTLELEKALVSSNTQQQDPELAARIGQVLMHRGDFARAARYLSAAVGPLDASGQWLEWVQANGSLALCEAAAGQHDAATLRARRGVDRARNLQGQYLILGAEFYQAFVQCLVGRPDETSGLLESTTAWGDNVHPTLHHIRGVLHHWYARRGGDKAKPARATLLQGHESSSRHARRADARAAQGTEAETGAQGASANGQDASNRPFMPWAARQAAFLAGVAQSEQHEDAEALALDALSLAQQRQDMFAEALARRYLACALAARDPNDEQIDAHMRRSRALFLEGGCPVESARTLVRWGKISRQRGDPEAEDRIARAEEIFAQHGMTWEVDWMKEELSST